jgi:hypothetical protein
MGNTRDTGYLRNLVVYDGSGNIVLPANLTVTGSIVGYATTSYVTTQINNLINGAPGLLDTLDELAAALGDDANFASTLTTSLSGKQASLSGTGFVKISGTTISYDNSTYLTTASATSTYLPLAGGIMSGNISYGVGNGVAFYLQPQAAGGGPTNGAVLRLKSHSGAGALSDRSGALAWIDGNGVRLDLFEWNSSLINAYVPINGTSAVFSSTITSFSTSGAAAFNNGINIHTQAGTYTAGHGGILQFQNEDVITGGIRAIRDGGSWGGALSFYTHNTTAGNTFNSTFVERMKIDSTGTVTINSTYFVPLKINTSYGQVGLEFQLNGTGFGGVGSGNNFTSDAGVLATDVGMGTNGSATSKLVFATGAGYSTRLTIAASGAATFSSTVNTAGLLTGQASIHQSDAGGLIASNRWSVYNGGATTMRFLYNPSGDVIFDNGTPRLTLGSGGSALFNVNASSSITLTSGGTDAAMVKAGPGDELYIGGNDTWQMRLSGGNILMDNGGNVGINTGSPSARLDINGSVRYRGDIYDQFNFVASGNYTNGTYYNIVGVNAIPTGIYILQGSIDTYAAGGGIYFVSFVSVPFYMWDVGSNSTTFVDLPPVLGTGHHLGNAFPLFRLQMTLGGAGIYLQFNPNSTWAGIDNVSGGKSFRVNLKRIG